ncbi:MAG: DNA segregation ATPase FtsK/SpoIIIE/DNA segregation ATPase FtsK/SpoIIIE [Chloroflexi bacterium]|nr:MAG: DNA segregation ATPase FtsK/SpoIIIE/DNA segregation ATPase FtsK/SpoIIIE [Chloroflexota bacterium]
MAAKRFNKKQPIPDILTIFQILLKNKTIGTFLILIGLLIIPGIFSSSEIIYNLITTLTFNIGVLLYIFIATLITVGVTLFFQGYNWFKKQFLHIAGLFFLLIFIAAIIGNFQINIMINNVRLIETSMSGDLGIYLNSQLGIRLLSFASLITGFSLLWPQSTKYLTKKIALIVTKQITLKNLSIIVRNAIRSITFIFNIFYIIFKKLFKVLSSFNKKSINKDGSNDDLENVKHDELNDQYPKRPSVILNSASTDDINKNHTKNMETAATTKVSQVKMDFENPVDEWRHSGDGWQLPPLNVLSNAIENTDDKIDIQVRAKLITETLSSFGVDSKVVEINEGPTVTQFGVEPGWDIKEKLTPRLNELGEQELDKNGNELFNKEIISKTRIRVNRITALQNDLALALATPSLRIEAPVPGKPIIGIEVPNSLNSIVNLKSLIEDDKFQDFKNKNNLPVALGQGVSGEPLLIDLAKMPHLLIAGQTGSGKSVCLSGIISCLLMNHSPSELRFILIDPKRVELTQFAKIPHLAFSDIIVETDKVVSTLRAVINEMENRYKKFAELKVRNIQTYNNKFPDDPLPYWVVIVDELADLMLSAPFEVETQLVRLAQLARATGIHLIVATQRPSVDVITGLIKANFPTRIAFAVTSQIDSRTIIDSAGAEKLLGKGDMLFLSPSAQKSKRIQGVYVDDEEIEKIVQFWVDDKFDEIKPTKQDHLIVEASIQIKNTNENDSKKTDDLFPNAIELISRINTVSVSLLQRKLRIGYPRAARLMDELEENNKVSPIEEGQSLRKVIHDKDIESINNEIVDQENNNTSADNIENTDISQQFDNN